MTPAQAVQGLRGILDLDSVRLSTKERKMADVFIQTLAQAAVPQAPGKPQPPAEPPSSDA